MPTVELTDDQVIDLFIQLPAEQRERIFARLATEPARKPQPRFGSGTEQIIRVAPDFDAPLEDFKEYQ